MPNPQRSKRSPDYPESPILSDETITNDSAKPSAVVRLLTLTSNPNVLFTIPVFLVGILRYTTLSTLIQYAHVRFKLKISTGATFYTETAAVNIFLFLFLIPQLTAYIRKKYHARPQTIDLFLVRTSVCLMTLGSLSIGLAPSKNLLPVGQSHPFLPKKSSGTYYCNRRVHLRFWLRLSSLSPLFDILLDNTRGQSNGLRRDYSTREPWARGGRSNHAADICSFVEFGNILAGDAFLRCCSKCRDKCAESC